MLTVDLGGRQKGPMRKDPGSFTDGGLAGKLSRPYILRSCGIALKLPYKGFCILDVLGHVASVLTGHGGVLE